MKRAVAVVLLALIVCLTCPLADDEAKAWIYLPASCGLAEELGYVHWGWNAMCNHDLWFDRMGLR